MPKFHSMILSPNISITVEGYLICENVPICRSGFQDYKGSELVGFPGFEEDWNLEPNTLYRVFRPKDEVLHEDFIKSLEGKTVVNEHPDGNVVFAENDGELNCGHIQNVRKGDDLPNGEVTLQGDLVIKDPELIERVRPEADPDNKYDTAARDVSCGYGMTIKRLADGTLVMYRFRGNHVAVVGRGRAGSRIAIQDSAPPEIKFNKERFMTLKQLIFGRGLQAIADASPEERESLAKEISGDESPVVDKKKATDAAEVHPAHACLDRCLDAKKMGDSEALDKHKKELFGHIGHEEKEEHAGDSLEELKERTAGDGELEQNEKTAAEESASEHAVDSEHAEKQINDPGQSIFKAANDSVLDYIKSTRLTVAAIANKPKSKRSAQEQTMVDSYNNTVRSINQTRGNAYSSLATVKKPTLMVAADAAVKTDDHECHCFDGVPYAIGQKRHEAYLAQKGNK